MRLEGKVAVVTGGGQGIGRAVALRFAREGCDVAIYDASLELGEKVAGEIRLLGRKALVIKCDVSNSEEVHQATQEVLDKFKRVDILVNNAGISVPALIEETTEALWDRVIDINLKGQFLCSQVIGRQMIKQRGGKIINIASLLAHVATPYLGAYAASKGGVLQLSKVMAVEWARYNINVNVVSPGVTDTPMNVGVSAINPGLLRDRVKRIPLRRQNQPEDIANAVLFLASSESDNITGQAIMVDGGIYALHSGHTWPEETSKQG
jgi:NAD(P)-dependent dehydrogenase (short-subunit alcohol dehydrogenase family)